ncbi:uncharacterized protein RSE6_02674 [Rhynchosporium secalis]|uniref:DUF4185 domain-containing protein n=1 Tax=Rhynchosporium secalis TaxID=38038 RepID=A0A1E1M0T6_RHYSE|nr:uncharacterized protein RSE6_02674 [Rhynchosporium secalis]
MVSRFISSVRKLVEEKEKRGAVAWPPRVDYPVPCGAHRDKSGKWYPRDIGRSTMLSNGHVLFQWGDTFSHDHAGNFLGLTRNTCSSTTNPFDCTKSAYKSHQHNGMVKSLIPGWVVQQKLAWSFSGIIETSDPGSVLISGWTWYEDRQVVSGAAIPVYNYTGLAKIEYDTVSKRVTATRVIFGDSYRLFNTNEARYGSMSAVRSKGYIYLYGQVNDQNKSIHVARVKVDQVTSRDCYEFWKGSGWVKWVDNLYRSVDVMRDIQHGAVFKSKMFGKHSKYKWVFIGCNGQGDNKVQMGRAISPVGPWDIKTLNYDLYPLDSRQQPGGYAYCVYPHPWVRDTCLDGDLVISWSEGGMTGEVMMAQLRLAIVGGWRET